MFGDERLPARFWSKVVPLDGGCWEWIGAEMSTGYGSFRLRAGVSVTAHRATYEHLVGPVPPGLELDHLCRNRACCSPAHLEPVTHAENMRRSRGLRRKHRCVHGHVVEGSNALPRPGKPGQFRCRKCLRASQAKYDAANRGRAAAYYIARRDVDPDKLREQGREAARRRRAKDPDAVRANHRRWVEKNRAHVNALAAKYRAKKKAQRDAVRP